MAKDEAGGNGAGGTGADAGAVEELVAEAESLGAEERWDEAHALLLDALGEVPMSAAEWASLAWLAGFELATVENIARVIDRARAER